MRAVQESLQRYDPKERGDKGINASIVGEDEAIYNATAILMELEKEMLQAANNLDFEKAAHLRDQIKELKKKAGIEK